MKTNQRLLQEVRRSGLLFGLTVFLGAMAGGMVILQAQKLSSLVNSVFLGHLPLAAVKPLFVSLLLIVLLRGVFTFLNGSTAAALSASIKKQMRSLLLQKINRLGPAFTTGESTGELTTSALQGIEALDAYFSQYLPQILLSALLPLLILAVVFPLDTLTGVVFLVTAPLIPFFMALVGRASENETRRQYLALSRLGSYFLDTLQGLATLKTLGQSRKRVTQIADVSEKYRQATLNVLRITFLSALTLELLATISTAVVAVEIGLRLLYGRIEFQQAFFILLLAPEFYQPLRMLGARFHAGMNGVAAAERIYAVLDRPEPLFVTVSDGTPVLEKPVTSFDLAFHKVSFSYPDRDRDALKEVSLTLASGRSYGLIGRSGAGKSTLMQLLLRFLVPAQGQITLNGVDIASIPLEEWRSQVSWVPQKPALLNASILENIRIAKPDATMDEIRLASSMARLDDFVMSLPEGYETVIYEQGGRVSSGEAQRIALARAFLKNAPLILMDEPTAHLDIDLEAELKEAVAQLMHDRMSLIIAHRLSTIKNVDALFLLEQGELIAQGTHEDLLGSSSLYQQMVRQAKGER